MTYYSPHNSDLEFLKKICVILDKRKFAHDFYKKKHSANEFCN